MLTGRCFLQGDSLVDILSEHQGLSLPSQESIGMGIGDDLYEVLRESLQKSPSDRVLDLQRITSWVGKVDLAELERSLVQRPTSGGPVESSRLRNFKSV
jgi:hypothetical protein